MVLIVYFGLLVVTIAVWYLLVERPKHKRFWELYNQFEGDTPLPIIGNGHKFGTKSEVILNNIFAMWERHGKKNFRALLGTTPFIFLCEPEDVEILLRNNKEITKNDDYNFFQDWLGNGLLLSTGVKWQQQRKIITPTFHFKILEQFINVFNRNGNILINNFSQNLDKIYNVYPNITLCALDIVCETAMGTNVNAQKNSGSEYVKAIYEISRLMHLRSFSVVRRFDIIYRFMSDYIIEKKLVKLVHDFSSKVIQTRKIQLKDEIAKKMSKMKTQEGEDQFEIKGKTAFLDLLLLSKTAEGKPLSEKVIREEVDTFMFEGHDTTSSCVAFAIYCLANNPEVQTLVFEEQYSIFGSDVTRECTMSDVNDMNYLERVIKETLRIYPSVPMFGRKLINDLPITGDKILPGGSMVFIPQILMGRNPKNYINPEKFDPERFTPENSLNRNPFLHVPFSAGPRNCIGQKFAMLDIKLLISKVVRNFEICSAGDKYNVVLIAEAILKSSNGINVILKKRMYE